MTTIQNNSDLLGYLVNQADADRLDWFNFKSQKIIGVNLAYSIASRHADKLTPEQITSYVKSLNNSIFETLIKPK